MGELRIQIDETRSSFEPGEVIPVTIEWEMPTPPDAIELRAVWNTIGKGTRDVGVEHTLVIDSPNATDSRRVEFPLPRAPYSFSGKLISLVWALELVALPSEESCRTQITLAPGSREIVLQRSDAMDPGRSSS